MPYDSVLNTLQAATADEVYFRNRFRTYDDMTNMLVALVAKGINLYLRSLAPCHAEMILHHLSHIASKIFKLYQLDGRWYGKHRISEPEPKKHGRSQSLPSSFVGALSSCGIRRGTGQLLLLRILDTISPRPFVATER